MRILNICFLILCLFEIKACTINNVDSKGNLIESSSIEEFNKCVIKINPIEHYKIFMLITVPTGEYGPLSDFPYISTDLYVESRLYGYLKNTPFQKNDQILAVDECPTSLIVNPRKIDRLIKNCHAPLSLFVLINTPEELASLGEFLGKH